MKKFGLINFLAIQASQLSHEGCSSIFIFCFVLFCSFCQSQKENYTKTNITNYSRAPMKAPKITQLFTGKRCQGWRRRRVLGKRGHLHFGCSLEVGSGQVGLTKDHEFSGGEADIME